MPKKKKIDFLRVKKDEGFSSRFLVDLKEDAQKKEEYKQDKISTFLEKVENFSFKQKKDKAKNFIFAFLLVFKKSFFSLKSNLPVVSKLKKKINRANLKKTSVKPNKLSRLKKKRKAEEKPSEDISYLAEWEERLIGSMPAKKTLISSAVSFALVLLFLALPFKIFDFYKNFDLQEVEGRVLGASESAVRDLISASKSASDMDFENAGEGFARAGESFLSARRELEEINSVFFYVAEILPGEKAGLASESQNILEAGEIASELGQNLSDMADNLFNIKEKTLFSVAENLTVSGQKSLTNAKALNQKLAQVNIENLPVEIREEFLFLQEKSLFLEKSLAGWSDILENLKAFLGIDGKKRYLLVFQNNNEMRASGGFIGSFALIDFNRGEIVNLEAPEGGSYDTEGGLRKLVKSPEPLSLVDPLWHFWDANWWPDWEMSAEKLMWFYENSDGPSVDGVISFTPTFLEDMLSVLGPIDLQEEYGLTVDKDNFWLQVQSVVEEENEFAPEPDQDKSTEPKKIIGDMMEKILEKLPKKLNKENLVRILKIFESDLNRKHILFYFKDEALQANAREYGWAGKIKEIPENWDYLSIVNTNIAGGKSDRRIEQVANLGVEIMPDGSVINSLEIKRTHTGVKGEPFCGVRNVNWMRVYVPEGSELLEARGFWAPNEIYFEAAGEDWLEDEVVKNQQENSLVHQPDGTLIYKEAGKTVFANWSMVDPGEEAVIYLRYKLPFKIEKKEQEQESQSFFAKFINKEPVENFDIYPLLLQKQPGAKEFSLNFDLKAPKDRRLKSAYPFSFEKKGLAWTFSKGIDRDEIFSAVLGYE